MALVALLVAFVLRRRARIVAALREVVADETGHVVIEGTSARTNPLVVGPALVPDVARPTGYREGAGSVRAIAGTRAAVVSERGQRILALELLAIAAVLTGIAPLLVAGGYVVPSPF